MREMKDSGIEWIGDIPKNWKYIKCKYISSFVNGYAFDSKDLCQNYVYPVIRIGDIKNGSIDFENCLGVNNNNGLEYYLNPLSRSNERATKKRTIQTVAFA